MGSITELATSAPGYSSIRPNEAATIVQILPMNGYNTAAFGKMHQTPAWEVSVSGPFTQWPIGDGFEKFYGFLGGETNQWAPLIYDGTTVVEFVFSADETEDVGEDLATPVTEDYKEGDNKFTGTIDKVTIAVTPPPAQVGKEEESGDVLFQEGIQ